METPSTPADGQSANLPAEISAKRSGVIRMSVHVPANWNPHADLLAIADLAAAAGKRADRFADMAAEAEEAGRFQQAEDYRQAARESITRENVREINFAVCLLAMRLSGCSITLPAAEAEQEGGAL